ncbi:MAG: hypothetical protein WC824_15965 [Bacteroidota bacterium]|jgi:hypothetical protein
MTDDVENVVGCSFTKNESGNYLQDSYFPIRVLYEGDTTATFEESPGGIRQGVGFRVLETRVEKSSLFKLMSIVQEKMKTWESDAKAREEERKALGLTETEKMVVVPAGLLIGAGAMLKDYLRYRVTDKLAYGPANDALNVRITNLIAQIEKILEK